MNPGEACILGDTSQAVSKKYVNSVPKAVVKTDSVFLYSLITLAVLTLYKLMCDI